MPSGIVGSRRKYNCIHCGKEKFWSYSSTNKFCGTACQHNWTWENITKQRIENGECTHNSNGVLKKYLIETRGEKCEDCGLNPIWNNKPLVLQLDHIDGNSDNNYPNNLRLLCPNCHSQTDNFGSKGQGSRYKKESSRNSYLREYKGR